MDVSRLVCRQKGYELFVVTLLKNINGKSKNALRRCCFSPLCVGVFAVPVGGSFGSSERTVQNFSAHCIELLTDRNRGQF